MLLLELCNVTVRVSCFCEMYLLFTIPVSGVFIARGKEDVLVTLNQVIGESVYGEKRMSVEVTFFDWLVDRFSMAKRICMIIRHR